MKKYFPVKVLMVVTMLLQSCSNGLSDKQITDLKQRGDNITNQLQAVFMRNLAQSIQEKGVEHAIDFCNLNAFSLTDSVSKQLNVTIQRVSDKNRNPENIMRTKIDSLVWNKIKNERKDFVEQDVNGDTLYYKPISIQMPTCLKCHGDNIESSAKKMLEMKYPQDKALNYSIDDLRGMWKVTFKKRT